MTTDPTLDVVIIDNRPLLRDCLGRSLMGLEPSLRITYLSTADELEAHIAASPQIVLINTNASRGVEEALPEIAKVKQAAPETAVVILSETENIADILQAFESGASGFIPPSIGLEVAVKAMQLVAAGGVYVPASILARCGQVSAENNGTGKAGEQSGSPFTSKQMAVIEALRRGKANKIIAYELNMCESTVKVHVRNVMKKLRAKNRTEAAYILNEKLKTSNRIQLDLDG